MFYTKKLFLKLIFIVKTLKAYNMCDILNNNYSFFRRFFKMSEKYITNLVDWLIVKDENNIGKQEGYCSAIPEDAV